MRYDLPAPPPRGSPQGFTAGAKPPPPGNRFAIELPVADASPATTTQITSDILNTLGSQLRTAGSRLPPSLTVVFADEKVADAAKRAGSAKLLGGSSGSSAVIMGLREACRADLTGLLVVVGPTVADVSGAIKAIRDALNQ